MIWVEHGYWDVGKRLEELERDPEVSVLYLASKR